MPIEDRGSSPRPAPTVAASVRDASQRLAEISDTARLDAELLMAKALDVSRSQMLVRHQDQPSPDAFEPLIERRLSAEPIAYILGECEFFGLELQVTPDVLIPRSDSECVVEAALEQCPSEGRVLDLGSGSGALLLAMLCHRPQLTGVGVDASAGALSVAKANCESLGMANRATFIEYDWNDEGWASDLGSFECIIANPPYVETDAQLDRSVRAFEPAAALFAGVDGLDAYRTLIPQLPALMKKGAFVVLEIGSTQADAVSAIARDAGFNISVRQDLGNRPRVLVLT